MFLLPFKKVKLPLTMGLTLLLVATTPRVVSSEDVASSSFVFDPASPHPARGRAVRGNQERALTPGKGSKDSKKKGGKGNFKEICLQSAFLFSVEGPTDAISGPTNINGKQCYSQRPSLQEGLCTGSPEKANEIYVECMEKAGFLVDNWFFNRDVVGTYQIVENPSNDLDGAFKGTVSNSNGSSKIQLEYFNTELVDKSLSLLTNIAFDYYIEQCPANCDSCVVPATSTKPASQGAACNPTASQCLSQLYVNIYTRNSPTSSAFNDCRFDYIVGTDFGTDPSLTTTKVWHSVSFNPMTNSKVGTCGKTFAQASAEGFVLSSANGQRKGFEGCSDPVSVKLNIGDTSCSDAGMIAYFDNIRIDFPFVDGSDTHIYNFQA